MRGPARRVPHSPLDQVGRNVGKLPRALHPGGGEISTSRGEAPLIVPPSPHSPRGSPGPLQQGKARAAQTWLYRRTTAATPSLRPKKGSHHHHQQSPLFPAGAGAPGFQKPAHRRRTHPPQSEQPRPPAAAATGPRAGGVKENLQQRPGASTRRLLLASRLGRREGRRPGGRLSTRERRPLPERKESAWGAGPGGDRAPGNARWALGCRPQSPGIRGEFSGDQREPAASRRRRKKEAGSVRGAPGGGSSNAPCEPADAWRLHWVSAAPPPRRAEPSRAAAPCRLL